MDSARITFLVRRDDEPKYLKYFGAIELCVMMGTLVLPPPVALIFRIPLWLAPLLTIVPLFLFIAIFRYNRPKSYFLHWLKFYLRGKVYRYSVASDRYLLSFRNRICLALVSIDERKSSGIRRWHEIGVMERFGEIPERVASENPYVRAVLAGQQMLRESGSLEP